MNAQTAKIGDRASRQFFSFTPITEAEFRSALKNNYNAPFVTKIGDTTKLESAFLSIEKTYSDEEKELADNQLCNSPRCITSFEAYYPALDLCLFYILDYHYVKAVFVSASTSEVISSYHRFRGSHGAMSKDELWVGLERGDCDNHLQMEVCKTSDSGAWSVFTFDFTYIDINEGEEMPIFWAGKNKIYIALVDYGKELLEYYSIDFEY